MQPLLTKYPLGFGQWLIALDYSLANPYDIAIVGAVNAEDTQSLLDVCSKGYRPHQVIAGGESGEIPLLDGRERMAGQATAYVCVDFTCRPPVTEPESLRELLDR